MSSVLGLPLSSSAPGLASLSPGPRATAREPGPEIGVIRAAPAAGDRPETHAERRGNAGSDDERQELPADGGRALAAWTGLRHAEAAAAAQAGHRPTAFAGGFLAQLFSQGGSWGGSGGLSAAPSSDSRQAALGSDAYRRAGGEPPVYSEAPSLFRIAV